MESPEKRTFLSFLNRTAFFFSIQSQELSPTQLIHMRYSQTREKDAHLNAIAEVSPCCHCHHGQESSASPNIQDNGFFPSLFHSSNCSTDTLKILGVLLKERRTHYSTVFLFLRPGQMHPTTRVWGSVIICKTMN